jgi:hypothetical protein
VNLFQIPDLKWSEYPDGAYLKFDAETVFGEYRIMDCKHGFEMSPHFEALVRLHAEDDSAHIIHADTAEQAKAAAQADFERRFREVLEPVDALTRETAAKLACSSSMYMNITFWRKAFGVPAQGSQPANTITREQAAEIAAQYAYKLSPVIDTLEDARYSYREAFGVPQPQNKEKA